VRFSFGYQNTQEELDFVLLKLEEILKTEKVSS
jgi:cysteine sulfinate desulfinase/cysteine desulfurase-like protein